MDFHIIIHKLTDLEAEQSISTIILIEKYLALHPTCVIIDSLNSIRKATSRFRACECLRNILQDIQLPLSPLPQSPLPLPLPLPLSLPLVPLPFCQPAYCVIEQKEEFKSKMNEYKIVFPVICKPIDACGIPGSHEMVSF